MRREFWTIMLCALGINLWALLCLMPLQLEWLAEDTQPVVVLAYVLPLIFLVGGLSLRWVGLLMLLFPVSFVPIYLVLPEADKAVHASLSGWLTLATSVAMYLCVAGVWLDRSPGPRRLFGGGWATTDGPQRRDGSALEAEPTARPPLRRHLWWPYQHHFAPRWVALLLLLVVPLYGVNFADGVAEAYTAGFGQQSEHAQVMANLIFVFVWIVVAYLYFFAPSLNLELEQRELDVIVRRYEERAMRRPSLLWILVAPLVALGLMALLMTWRMG